MLPIYAIALYISLALILAWLVLVFIGVQFSVPEDVLGFLTLGWIDLSKLDTTTERIQAAQVVATATGGLAVVFNLYYGAKRSEASLQNSEAATRNAKAAEDGQITERFSRAIEQLSSEKIETRIGGVYTLERIAWDSEQDHWTVIETLSAFIRENASYKKRDDKFPLTEFKKNQNNEYQDSKPNTDIQAALTVIGRRNHEQDPASKHINLSYSDLQQTDWSWGKFDKAILIGSNLQKAFLKSANLQGASLCYTNLQYANLVNAELQNANLQYTNLKEAFLSGTKLQGAFLNNAKLEEIPPLDSDNSEMSIVENEVAKQLAQNLIECSYGDESTTLPDFLQRPKHWKTSKEHNISDREVDRKRDDTRKRINLWLAIGLAIGVFYLIIGIAGWVIEISFILALLNFLLGTVFIFWQAWWIYKGRTRSRQ